MECYLDNSATTQCFDSVAAIMTRVMCQDYGNPSSMHVKGVQAEQYLRYAKDVIARTLKVNEKEIFFTSCPHRMCICELPGRKALDYHSY